MQTYKVKVGITAKEMLQKMIEIINLLIKKEEIEIQYTVDKMGSIELKQINNQQPIDTDYLDCFDANFLLLALLDNIYYNDFLETPEFVKDFKHLLLKLAYSSATDNLIKFLKSNNMEVENVGGNWQFKTKKNDEDRFKLLEIK